MTERSSEVVHRLISTERPEDAVASYYAFACRERKVHLVEEKKAAAVLVTAQSRFGPVGIFRATSLALVAP
ncbi:MAG: hypothetical protein ACYSUN_11430, partial [Planctomycetota bacterium]